MEFEELLVIIGREIVFHTGWLLVGEWTRITSGGIWCAGWRVAKCINCAAVYVPSRRPISRLTPTHF